ncbi:MAG TPA: YceI family protein [Mycobacteriales bacterium]
MTAVTDTATGYRTGTWTIDPVHSTVGFVARHMMVSKVRGKFGTVEGTIVTAENPLESTATATIDLSSVDTGNAQRDNHLRSADFFSVEKNKIMTFTSTGIEPDGDDYRVTGDLTLNGITKPITFALTLEGFGPDPYGGVRAGFTGTGSLSRKDWGITFNGAIEGGGVVVSDKIDLVLEVEAVLAS